MPEDIFWERYVNRFRTFSPLDSGPINGHIDMVICIPVFAEPDLLRTLDSLSGCDYGDVIVEVLLLFNRNEFMTVEEISVHDSSIIDSEKWISEHHHPNIKWISLVIDKMPDPKGGVGWARKLCMDEAARRLGPEGIIVCLDADCTVANNYLIELKKSFDLHADQDAASIYFEHSLDNLDKEERDSIIDYELHLRYLIQAQQWCGHPHAYQTVGSSMAVRRNAYLAQGGMNTRRAGEDFYFLHKFTVTNNLFDITSTTVYPSARISTRVPFGTGKAMQTMKNTNEAWLTPNFQSFREIKILFTSLDELWNKRKARNKELQIQLPNLPVHLSGFLKRNDFESTLREITSHTSTLDSFRKRFFRYFNAFQMIKYMHFMRDHCYPDINIADAVRELMTEKGESIALFKTNEELLKWMRDYDRRLPI